MTVVNRADRIFDIIKSSGGKMRVADVRAKLAEVEEVATEDLGNVVSPTVGQDNKTRDQSGRRVRFKTYGYGTEQFGWVGIIEDAPLGRSKGDFLKEPTEQIPELIEAANNREKKRLKEAIMQLSWREFESNFLIQVLEALGFTSVEVTRAVKDGGIDAICQYKRGIVQSEAYVSAKKWKQGKNVGPNEVTQLKGLAGRADTGIIFTSASFTKKAQEAAEPVQGLRSVVLIDIDLIVDTCFSENIGVKEAPLPKLSEFVGFEFELQEFELEG
jgi:hypothetical protein